MSGQQLTQPKYTLQQIVILFGELLSQLVAQRGSLMFLYEGEGLWRRFDLARLLYGARG
jgi:hypothetical protein